MKRLSRVLCAVAIDDRDRSVFEHALALARRHDAKMLLLNAVSPQVSFNRGATERVDFLRVFARSPRRGRRHSCDRSDGPVDELICCMPVPTRNAVHVASIEVAAVLASLPSCVPSSSRCSIRSIPGSVAKPRFTSRSSRPTPNGLVNRFASLTVRLTAADRMLWAWLSRAWRGWRSAVHIIKPENVVAWHRRDFDGSGRGRADTAPGAQVSRTDVRALISELSRPITLGCAGDSRRAAEVGDLRKSVDRREYMRRIRPPSHNWRTFLANHASQIVAADLLVVRRSPSVAVRPRDSRA